jgi:DNA-binding CsgD family transcriptional regulator
MSAMSDLDSLSRLLGRIYDTTLDRTLWQAVVGDIAAYIPGSFVNLFSQDAVQKTAEAFYTFGIEPHFLQLYFEKYIHINPLFPAMLFFDVEQVLTEEDVLPMSEFVETRFYREWVAPQGLVASMAAILEKSATSLAGIAVGRAALHGPVDCEARGRMSQVVPHLRRALSIGKVVDLRKLEADAFADTLDGLAAALFIVDRNMRIVHANLRALLMIKDKDVVSDLNGKLRMNAPEEDFQIKEIVARAEQGNPADDRNAISRPLTSSNGVRYVAHMLLLTSGRRQRAGATYSGVAAIFIAKASLNALHPLQSLATAYKLTPTEMRVLMALVQVGGVPEAVPILGISEATIKTHLSRIFAKTGSRRQADLVKIVAAYASPLS